MEHNVLTAPPSARDLRARYRSDQSNNARLRMLTDAGRVLATQRGDAALAGLLGLALEFSAFEAGAVLADEGDALRIKASKGPVLPAGARFTADGALAAALKPGAGAALEILLPLTAGGDGVGVLALVSAKPLTDPAPPDLQTLETLATMMAMTVREGAAMRAPQAARDIAQTLAPLTPREREVLALLPQGFTNADIGQRLGIATGTVKVHVERIIHKLALGDRTQAAALAVELGFVTSGARPA